MYAEKGGGTSIRGIVRGRCPGDMSRGNGWIPLEVYARNDWGVHTSNSKEGFGGGLSERVRSLASILARVLYGGTKDRQRCGCFVKGQLYSWTGRQRLVIVEPGEWWLGLRSYLTLEPDPTNAFQFNTNNGHILESTSDARTRGHSLKLKLQTRRTRARHNYFNQSAE